MINSKKNYLIVWPLLGLFITFFCVIDIAAQPSQSAYNITSPITGLVKKVNVKSGQDVKKGDLLVEFDDSLITSTLSEVQAKIKLEKLHQKEAFKEFERAEELYDRAVLSEQELQQAKILYSKATVHYAAAKNKLVHIQWELDQIRLYAPFSGKVEQVYCYPGQYVNNKLTTHTLMTLQSD
ncbi:MAG: efflux RND transporter periplasmic adaptor subunit [Gammaproteobacteria bacterium]|nr:efflux RND transporter periplasmic adaptor subunit [Gammaproteobacteria bacterium]